MTNPTPSRFPPRAYISAEAVDNEWSAVAVLDQKQMQVGHDYYEYLSVEEHEHLLREAVAKTWEEAVERCELLYLENHKQMALHAAEAYRHIFLWAREKAKAARGEP